MIGLITILIVWVFVLFSKTDVYFFKLIPLICLLPSLVMAHSPYLASVIFKKDFTPIKSWGTFLFHTFICVAFSTYSFVFILSLQAFRKEDVHSFLAFIIINLINPLFLIDFIFLEPRAKTFMPSLIVLIGSLFVCSTILNKPNSTPLTKYLSMVRKGQKQ